MFTSVMISSIMIAHGVITSIAVPSVGRSK